MFTSIYVYDRKTPDKYAFAKWEKFNTLDGAKMSFLWASYCELTRPVYFSNGDYCTLCTQQAPDTLITDVVETWGYCKNCGVAGKGTLVISDIRGRPVVFYYGTGDEAEDEDPVNMVGETISCLNYINYSLAFPTRRYVNGPLALV